MTNSYTYYYGLIFCCPLGNETTACKYKELRSLKMKEKMKFYDALSDKEKKELIKYHQKCLINRENKMAVYYKGITNKNLAK